MKSYLKGLEFVLSAIASQDTLELLRRPFPEPLMWLPHPSGNGHLPCGREVYSCLRVMAERGLARSSYIGRVEAESVFRELKEIVVQRFLREKRELNTQEADRAVSAAVKKAATSCRTLTHFIPCHLGHAKNPESFSIGPVRFLQQRLFAKQLEGRIDQYRKRGQEAENNNFELLASDAREYYDSFGWIAEITIENCDPKTSRRRAGRMIQGALDCLHLVIGADYSNHMQAGGPNFRNDRRGHIASDTAGRLELSVSIDWLSNALGDDWWEQANLFGGDKIIGLLGDALNGANRLPTPAPLAQRVMDSASWFGEAVRDEFDASRVVKYVTAIERILTAKKNEDVGDALARRGAALLHVPGRASIEHLTRRLKKLYDLRSSLVHGSLSPLAENLRHGVTEAEELARELLLSSVQFFGSQALQKYELSDHSLNDAYERLVESTKMRAGTECDQT